MKIKNTTTALYTVWVGGVEVNDYLLSLDQAQRLKQAWVADGYDDAVIDKYDDADINKHEHS